MDSPTLSRTASGVSISSPLPLGARLLALWPAVLAAALFLGIMAHYIHAIKANEGGRFVYPVDDGYAHMAIAKNLVQHGTWTFNVANGFETASSSMIWPVMLAAAFAVLGVHEWIPLALNMFWAVAFLLYAGDRLRRAGCSGALNLLVLVGIVVFTPLPAVASTGMEHMVQLLLTVAFVDLAARLLMDAPGQTTPRTPVWLCVTGVLLVMTRYEGLFFIATVGFLLLCRRRWKLAVVLGCLAITPITVFGLYSVFKGWYFLPNSLVLKGNTNPLVLSVPGLIQYFNKGFSVLVDEEYVLVVMFTATLALFATLRRHGTLWTYPALVLLITWMVAAQHFQFASLGWFYRYEAYLIALAYFGVGIVLGEGGPALPWREWLRPAGLLRGGAFALAVLLFEIPQWPRVSESYPHIVTASYSIYGQQYQMAHFVRRFYNGKGIIANDVGAISFMGEGLKLLDYFGLSNIEVLRLRRAGRLDQAAIARLAKQHDAEIAIVYNNWANEMFGGALPEWVKVGTWTIPHNTVCAFDEVTFYATRSEFAPALVSHLRAFASELPRDVRQAGLYLDANALLPVGTYPPGGVKGSLHYWTTRGAQFNVYPADDKTLAAGDATLSLAVRTINQGQTIRVYFNDELVAAKAFTPAESERWTSFPVRVKWRPGANTLKLEGEGTAVQPPGDGRRLLFAVLDPRRVLDEVSGTVAQPGVMQGND